MDFSNLDDIDDPAHGLSKDALDYLKQFGVDDGIGLKPGRSVASRDTTATRDLDNIHDDPEAVFDIITTEKAKRNRKTSSGTGSMALDALLSAFPNDPAIVPKNGDAYLQHTRHHVHHGKNGTTHIRDNVDGVEGSRTQNHRGVDSAAVRQHHHQTARSKKVLSSIFGKHVKKDQKQHCKDVIVSSHSNIKGNSKNSNTSISSNGSRSSLDRSLEPSPSTSRESSNFDSSNPVNGWNDLDDDSVFVNGNLATNFTTGASYTHRDHPNIATQRPTSVTSVGTQTDCSGDVGLEDNGNKSQISTTNGNIVECIVWPNKKSPSPDIIFGHQPDPSDIKEHSTVLTAAKSGDLQTLKKGPVVTTIRDREGNTPLHLSAQEGHVGCVTFLCHRCPAWIKTENRDKLSPPATAIKFGHIEVLDWMVENTTIGQELGAKRSKRPLVQHAAKFGQDGCLRLLLEKLSSRGELEVGVDAHGNSPAHIAAKYGQLTCLQTLVEYGLDVTSPNQYGQSPCFYADFGNHRQCVAYLMVMDNCLSLAKRLATLERNTQQGSDSRDCNPAGTQGGSSSEQIENHANQLLRELFKESEQQLLVYRTMATSKRKDQGVSNEKQSASIIQHPPAVFQTSKESAFRRFNDGRPSTTSQGSTVRWSTSSSEDFRVSAIPSTSEANEDKFRVQTRPLPENIARQPVSAKGGSSPMTQSSGDEASSAFRHMHKRGSSTEDMFQRLELSDLSSDSSYSPSVSKPMFSTTQTAFNNMDSAKQELLTQLPPKSPPKLNGGPYLRNGGSLGQKLAKTSSISSTDSEAPRPKGPVLTTFKPHQMPSSNHNAPSSSDDAADIFASATFPHSLGKNLDTERSNPTSTFADSTRNNLEPLCNPNAFNLGRTNDTSSVNSPCLNSERPWHGGSPGGSAFSTNYDHNVVKSTTVSDNSQFVSRSSHDDQNGNNNANMKHSPQASQDKFVIETENVNTGDTLSSFQASVYSQNQIPVKLQFTESDFEETYITRSNDMLHEPVNLKTKENVVKKKKNVSFQVPFPTTKIEEASSNTDEKEIWMAQEQTQV